MEMKIEYDATLERAILKTGFDKRTYSSAEELWVGVQEAARAVSAARDEEAREHRAFSIHHKEHSIKLVDGCFYCVEAAKERARLAELAYARTLVEARDDGVIINRITPRRFDEHGKAMLSLNDMELDI